MSKSETEAKLEMLEAEALQAVRVKFIQDQFTAVKNFEEFYKTANLIRKDSRFRNPQMQKKIAKIAEVTMEKIIHSLPISKLENIIAEGQREEDRFFLNVIIPSLHLIIKDYDNLLRIIPKLDFQVDRRFIPYVYTLLVNLLDGEPSLFEDLRCFELAIRYATPKEISQLCEIAKDNLLSYFVENSWFYPSFYRYLMPVQIAALHAVLKSILPANHLISDALISRDILNSYCLPEVTAMVLSFAEELKNKAAPRCTMPTCKLMLVLAHKAHEVVGEEEGMQMQPDAPEMFLS